MQVEATLTYTDEDNRTRNVLVRARHFSIGRNPENDLQFADANLSRQHALIERFDNFLQITDCGSQNGTAVNGAPISGAVELRHGDVITLGGVFDLQVSLRAAAAAPAAIAPVNDLSSLSEGVVHKSAATLPAGRHQPWWMSIPVLAALGTALVFVLAAAVILLVVSQEKRSSSSKKNTLAAEEVANDLNSQTSNNAATETTTSDAASIVVPQFDGAAAVNARDFAALERIESAAEQVMRRISTDSKDYSFSEKAVRDIAQKIESYRASSATVRGAIDSLQKAGPSIAAAARNEGIAQPYLLLYAALAATDGGRSERDAATTAQAMLPDLIALRTTLGDDQDSSLLVIAAYPEGTGTKKSHPLLGRMRRIIREPVTQRNVWYLHEHGGLSAEAYELVIRFLALGAIAQNPTEFGVNTQPLAF